MKKYIGPLAVFALVAWGVLALGAYRTTKLEAAMNAYDVCMVSTYGMSSAQYYQQNQSLPECK